MNKRMRQKKSLREGERVRERENTKIVKHCYFLNALYVIEHYAVDST